jgi:tetratricopeptide (TPR) repeat protein
MAGMAHVELSAMNQRSEDVWKNSILKAGYGREYGSDGYAWVARYTLQFLDAYLKHESAAVAYLQRTPDQNGVPAHFITIDARAAQGMPPSLDAYRAELGRQGFDHAADVYASMQKDNPGFALDQKTIDRWAYELMSDEHLPEAINLLKLNASKHPDSGDVYDSLADAYMRSGNKPLAIENYTQSLAKDPNNANATIKLKQLKGTAAATK